MGCSPHLFRANPFAGLLGEKRNAVERLPVFRVWKDILFFLMVDALLQNEHIWVLLPARFDFENSIWLVYTGYFTIKVYAIREINYTIQYGIQHTQHYA